MTAYNRRFGKAPRHDFDVHRPLETDDDLTAFFTWREPRRVSKSLTVQYDKVLYLIEDNELSRRAIGKYIEVWHYPDGRKELRLNGVVLPYSTYDRLQEIDQGAIVDNKRLGRTLEFIKLVQDKRDNNRSQALPAGDGPSRRRRKPTEKKSQRSLDEDDMLNALKTLQSRSDEIDVIKLTEISAVVRENHLASQKVLQKSGLRYVKEIHDVKDAPPSLLYSISVDEWLRNLEVNASV
ncbi:transposase [Klebsiella pneumoniae]|nr:transposase [Klebsiella pneumoniae]